MWHLTQTARAALGATLVSGALVACGGTNDSPPPPPPARPAVAAAQAQAAAPSADNSVQAMVAEIERSAFTVESRDPFMPPRPEARSVEGSDANLDIRPCDLEEHPLGNTDLRDLTLLGLITGTPLPRALFVPRGGAVQGVIVTEGTYAGPNCEQELTTIRDNEVVFEQRTTGDTGRATTVITLNEERVAAEILGYR